MSVIKSRINIITTTLLLLTLCHISIKAEVTDTLLNIETASKLVIMENPEGTFVEVTTEDGNKIFAKAAGYPPGAKVQTSQSTLRDVVKIPLGGDCNVCSSGSWDLSFDGLCIGLNDAMGQTERGLQWSKSFEISWLSCLSIVYSYSRSKFSIGLGFDWRNYKATIYNRWLVPSSNGGIEWGEAPEDSRVKSTRLKVFSLQVPLFYEWKIPKSRLSFKAGPIACFNTHASIRGVYDGVDSNSYRNKGVYSTKDFSPRRFTVDLFGSLSYGNGIGVYIRYSPMKVFNDSSPLNFRSLTLGVGFFI